jgi:hypothetical protein
MAGLFERIFTLGSGFPSIYVSLEGGRTPLIILALPSGK